MKTISREEFEKQNVFGTCAENTGFVQYFIGNSYLNPLTDPKNCAVFMANVLNRDAVITGTFTTQQKAVGSFCSAQQERDGIRKKEKRHLKNDFSFFKCLFWNHRLLIRCKRYGCYRG